MTKTCFACDRDAKDGYWVNTGERHLFYCDDCADETARRVGIRDDGEAGTEYVVVNVIETGENHAERIASFGVLLHGDDDAALIQAAAAAVAERGYELLPANAGGCYVIGDGETCREVGITVTS